MVDIAKCSGEGTNKEGENEICPCRESCLRYITLGSEYYQSWMIPSNIGMLCEEYWEVPHPAATECKRIKSMKATRIPKKED